MKLAMWSRLESGKVLSVPSNRNNEDGEGKSYGIESSSSRSSGKC